VVSPGFDFADFSLVDASDTAPTQTAPAGD
jgi:predicted cupin superfamily sugar epimerase